ncbi:uncharacterized protein BX663DRAFT_504928 [Cokeromyces recurvatus]|uniref:uncharacterized protein n=1 Tax=Cokeromyces recurvatus TaxID=90255 RepID=UPI0022211AD5|nr:uncharacterized protein BX663DRAFT_504928 [Cokeromyces recurvatus]KAI7904398.1 hypothetical protein BX663DRAFT_504928 [Cokeromyces recurvatus]
MPVKRYEFNPPSNIDAIRSNIMQRIKKERYTTKSLNFDNGLPSPPSEACSTFEDEISLTEPVSPVDSVPDSPLLSTRVEESSDAIREKIKLLKEEKHKLFQTMKDLLSQPKDTTTTNAMTTKPTIATTTTSSSSSSSLNLHPTTPIRPNNNNTTTRPRISEFNCRSISRYNYHERRSPTRFYTNDTTRGYPYNSTMTSSHHHHHYHRSSSSLNMSSSSSRRSSCSSSSNNPSYVSSRLTTVTSNNNRPANIPSFRLTSRYSRY